MVIGQVLQYQFDLFPMVFLFVDLCNLSKPFSALVVFFLGKEEDGVFDEEPGREEEQDHALAEEHDIDEMLPVEPF